MPTIPILQRYQAQVTLDASGNGEADFTSRGDFLLQRTRWLVQGGTGTNQATVENYIDGVPFEGSQSGNNDQSSSVQLLPAQTTLSAQWTGGPPGGTATVYLWGLEYPSGTGLAALSQGAGALSGGEGPGNPILGGDTLIRDAIMSADYVAGTTGWAVFRNGNIDLNSGTFRGTLEVDGPDGSKVTISNTAGGEAQIRLFPPPYNDPTVVNNPVVMSVANGGSLGLEDANFAIRGANPSKGLLAGAVPIISMTSGQLDETNGSSIELLTDEVSVQDLLIVGLDQVDVGSGYINAAWSSGNSAAVTAETAVLTITGFNFRAGRAYELKYGGGAQCATANNNADFRCKKSTAGVLGAGYGEFYRVPLGTTANVAIAAYGSVFVKNTTAADIVTDIALTLQSAGAAILQAAGGGRQRYFIIRDAGDATNPSFAGATVAT